MVGTSAMVALFHTPSEAEAAVRGLERAGFEMTNLSIVGKEHHSDDHVVGAYFTDSRMKYWGTLGAFLGDLLSSLAGAAFFWAPGIGPLVVGGPLVHGIVSVLEGATDTGCLTILGAGLYSIGIPKDSVLQYETLLEAGKFMLILHGTKVETEQAHHILEQSKAMESSLHHGISMSREPGIGCRERSTIVESH